MKLSIIIPAYKVENYIEKCIRSLENQDMPATDYEIIVTNDGSPDRCREIIEKLQEEFSNIVLINQENQGVSMARNNAIAIAKGIYILPIDPDDYVVPNVLQTVYQNAVSRDLDVLYLPYEIFDVNGKSIWETNYSKHKDILYTGVEGYFQARGFDVKDPDRSWAILYKKTTLDKFGILYPKDVPYLEDGLFLGKVFTVAEKVGFDNEKFYQRTTRLGSATNSGLFYTDKANQGFILAAQDIRKFCETYDFNRVQQGLINHLMIKYVMLALMPLVSFGSFKKYIKVTQKIKSLGFSRLASDGVVEPYRKYAKYYTISPYFFLLLYTKELLFKKIK